MSTETTATTESPKFIAIKNWDKYQTEMRNKVDWIKDYVEKDSDPDYANLTCLQRYVLDACCRLRGRFAHNLYNDPTWLAQVLHIGRKDAPHLPHAIRTLAARGFFALTNQQLSPREEKEKRKRREENNTNHIGAGQEPASNVLLIDDSKAVGPFLIDPKPNPEPAPSFHPSPAETISSQEIALEVLASDPSPLPQWKNLAVAYRKYFGAKASVKHFQERYQDACAKYPESIVMACFHTWAPGGKRWADKCNVSEPLYAFFKHLPEEAEDAMELARVPIEKAECLNVEEHDLGDFSDEVSALTDAIIAIWPKKNEKGSSVNTDAIAVAGRVDWILHRVPNADGELLLEAARAYLELKRPRYQSAQAFFTDDHHKDGSWRDHAKAVRFRQRLEKQETSAAVQ